MNDVAVVSTSDNLANLPEEVQKKILEYSKQIQNNSTISVSRIRLDAKQYIFPDQVETQAFSGIIVGTKHANIWYKDAFVQGKPTNPQCFAVGDAACSALVPHSKVTEPVATNCGSCPNFQWGSSGKGKACAEHTLLAVYIPSFGEDLFFLEQKKGNSRIADSYLVNVTKKYGTPLAVLTEFTMGAKNKWEQQLVATKPIAVELVMTLANRMEEASNMIEMRVVDSYKPTGVDEDTNAPSENDDNDRPSRSR